MTKGHPSRIELGLLGEKAVHNALSLLKGVSFSFIDEPPHKKPDFLILKKRGKTIGLVEVKNLSGNYYVPISFIKRHVIGRFTAIKGHGFRILLVSKLKISVRSRKALRVHGIYVVEWGFQVRNNSDVKQATVEIARLIKPVIDRIFSPTKFTEITHSIEIQEDSLQNDVDNVSESSLALKSSDDKPP